MNSKRALEKLLEGNRRFCENKMIYPNQGRNRRNEGLKGQAPFAIILGCSDSRIPPELLFDRGLGDLFVIRNAGNIIDDVVLASIEYALEHLGTTLVIVLGHSNCGAVSAAIDGGENEGHYRKIFDSLLPAVENAKEMKGDIIDNAIRENARLIANKIRMSEPIIKRIIKSGEAEILGAYYDIKTGKVEIL